MSSVMPFERETPDIPEGVARQAVEWLIEFQSGSVDPMRVRAWRRWREASSEHERAWLRIEAVDGRLRQVGQASIAIQAVSRAGASRRRALKLCFAGMATVGGTFFVVAPRTPQWQRVAATHSTRVGERRSLVLDDGTRVALNTDTALKVRYADDRRLLELLRGEILIETGSDPAKRPFLVRTARGDAQALGTRFTVREHAAGTRVSVWEGLVELQPRDGGGRILLRAGQQGSYTSSSARGPEALDPYAASWERGYLTADHTPLDVFLAEVARYRPGFVSCDPAVAHLRVSGTFPLDDTDRILASLPAALPVALHTRTRYWVRVQAPR